MAEQSGSSQPAGDSGSVVTPEYVENVGQPVTHQPAGETFDAEVVDSAAKFDQHFGPTALGFLQGGTQDRIELGDLTAPGEVLEQYNLITKGADGVETIGTIHAADIEDATSQAWEQIAKDQNVAAAQLEWAGGNEVSYFYDRKQGIEVSRPAGLALLHEVPKLTREEKPQRLRESSAPAQKQGYSREDLVRQLRAYVEKNVDAQKTAGFRYLPAEAAIAMNLANQLEAGAKTIDLSQRYATDDAAAAQARHQKALENLAPVLREAEKQTEKLSHGQAIAHGKGELLAVQQLQRGLSNAQGFLQKAAHHHGHHAQAPRLSMSSDGGL